MFEKIKLINDESFKEELKLTIDKMVQSEKFAEKIPCLKEFIIKRKLNSAFEGVITDRYKSEFFPWNLCRNLYKGERKPTNYENEFENPMYLFSLYINTLSIYDLHDKFGMEELAKFCFYFDYSNSTFYVEDSKIKEFLEAYLVWVKQAKEKAKIKIRENKINELKKELEKAQRI